MASSAETYCLCGQPYNVGQFMIECDCCREWFHGSCVNVKIYQSEDIDKYHCPKCVPTYGSSIFKVATNEHRQDRYEVNADRRPVQTGSWSFISALSARAFPADQHVISMQAGQFTEAYLKEKGFNRPLLFENPTGLELRVPPSSSFDVRSVRRMIGASREIDVIDVTRQSNFKMALGDFVDYFIGEDRTKVLNVLSLEFSDTPMSEMVEPPLMARQLDWVQVVWPENVAPLSPLVQKYCIMSSGSSYTDFHVDFGGTTVWYHVLHGRKIFYLIPPTATNLALYQQWSTSNKQNEVFFGDLVESCSACTLKKGQTMFIPTGWIHAVLTIEDSMVFGGNFLHSLNIELQLQVNEIEKQIDTPTMFRFPSFETIHWYAGSHLLQQLRRINEEHQDKDFTLGERCKDSETGTRVTLDVPPYLLRGVRILAAALREWNATKAHDQSKKDNIPDGVNSGQLVRELARELKRLERSLPPAAPVPGLASPVKKKRKRPKPHEAKTKPAVSRERPFASVSSGNIPLQPLVSPTFPSSSTTADPRSLYNRHNHQPPKRTVLKLTLPKPIMHVPDSNNVFSNSSQDSEDAELTSMATMACRSGMASYGQGYDSQDSFGGDSDYRVPEGARGNRPALASDDPYAGLSNDDRGGLPPTNQSDRSQERTGNGDRRGPPPDYAAPLTSQSRSILESHLTGEGIRNTSNRWTISKSRVRNNATDQTDEQVLFTNENLTPPSVRSAPPPPYVARSDTVPTDNGPLYGPGMYDDSYGSRFSLHGRDVPGPPDYSPVEPADDYLGPTAALKYDGDLDSDPASPSGFGGNFANNSDPYRSLPPREENEGVSFHPPRSRGDFVEEGDATVIIDNNHHSSGGLVVSRPPPAYGTVVPAASGRSDRPSRRRVDPRSSIYDYDEPEEAHPDDGALCIDETARPPAASRSAKKKKPKHNTISGPIAIGGNDTLKITIPAHMYRQETNESRSHSTFAAPKNGIESLLQASAYAGSSDNQERDAVAGMLSIGQSYGLARAEPQSRRQPPPEAPPIRAVHRDDEYVYPSLEMSSDDEEGLPPSRRTPQSKSHRRKSSNTAIPGDREDESWSPRGRLGRLLPRSNRPARRGSRREAVQAALRAARLKGVPQEHQKEMVSTQSLGHGHGFVPPPATGSLSSIVPSPLSSSAHLPHSLPHSHPVAVSHPHSHPLPLAHPHLHSQPLPRPRSPEPPNNIQPNAVTTHMVPHIANNAVSHPSANHRPADAPPTHALREPASLTSLKKPYRKKRPVKPPRPIPVQHVLPSPATPKAVKFKKGMKTAKQRLGKILKIHKMIC